MKPDVPPSYEDAVNREAWTIIAPWIPSSDLCSVCLVSRRWYRLFVPFLWGDPASHFGIANDAVYIALTRFKRVLRRARLSTRSLTHTLHLPAALSEIYGGPNPTWLRDVLEFLPNLQSLIVTKLPFFDHPSLLALRTTSWARNLSSEEDNTLPPFGLKLLLASSEPNTTSLGLGIALSRFPYLVYLDLSHTTSARDASVLATLSGLYDLQVLKLRGVGLKDGEAEVLANAIGIRVRLLDLRDNFLTDMSVRSLMQACFIPADRAQNGSLNVEDWPVGMAPGPDFFSLDTLRNEELDHELLKQLTKPLTGRLAFEDIPHRGLTHLYISGNRLSVEGLSSLLKSERLHILDGGTVDTIKDITRTQSLASPTGYIDEVKFPGAEKLIPVLAKSASKNLTYLRIDHALVTEKLDIPKQQPESRSKTPSIAEAQGSQPLAAELHAQTKKVAEAPAPAHFAVELPANTGPIFELDATPVGPRAELVGDSIYFSLSPPVGEKPRDESPVVDQSPIRADGAFAPEPVPKEPESPTESEASIPALRRKPTFADSEISEESGTGTQSSTKSILSPVSPIGGQLRNEIVFQSTAPPPKPPRSTPMKPAASTSNPGSEKPRIPAESPTTPTALRPTSISPTLTQTQRQARIEYLLSKRPKPLANPGSKAPRNLAYSLDALHPSALPNLRTLILTNVPLTVAASSQVISRLKEFISACADESALSRLSARTNYSLPPGRARHMAELEHARSLFGLRTIVLEMADAVTAPKRWEHSRQRLSMSKSSTGDHDSENLWSAGQNDFSFFGEEGEEKDECGIYDHEPGKYFPSVNFDDKIPFSPDDDRDLNSPPSATWSNGGTLSPYSMNFGGGSFRSPRNLPLGRNRRPSNESQRGEPTMASRPRSLVAEVPGGPVSDRYLNGTTNGRMRPVTPTSNPGFVSPPPEEEEKIDVIAQLAAWRKERKKAYEEELVRFRRDRSGSTTSHNGIPTNNNEPRGYGYGFMQGMMSPANGRLLPNGNGHANGHAQMQSPVPAPNVPPSPASGSEDIDMRFVEGHWKGEVKVVRNPKQGMRSGMVDMYGNYFEKGYLYP